MNASDLPNSLLHGSRDGLARRLAVAAFLVAIAYAGAAVATAPHIAGMARGLLFPMRLFLIAVAPTIAGMAFLWTDRAISDLQHRRLTRILVLVLCGYAGLVAVSGVPW